ncbi:MAG TPA: hypothetical protein VFV38_26460, partial [Ktedonobacteraceae bacterium]|nr:hypothetical protein [Ktedonobacteraceae bacterium]
MIEEDERGLDAWLITDVPLLCSQALEAHLEHTVKSPFSLSRFCVLCGGFLEGMPYAVALGWDLPDWRLAAGLESSVRPEAAILVGGYNLDQAESAALERHPILHVETSTMVQPDVAKRMRAMLHARANEAQVLDDDYFCRVHQLSNSKKSCFFADQWRNVSSPCRALMSRSLRFCLDIRAR